MAFFDLIKLNDENTGGGKSILLVDHKFIISIPKAINCEISDNILISPQATVFEIQFTNYTLQFKETYKDEVGSLNARFPVLIGQVPKDRSDVVCLFKEMTKHRFVVIYTDNNGYKKLIGTKKTPAIFRFDRDNKDNPNSRNEYKLSLTAPTREPIPFVATNNTFEEFANALVYQTRSTINTQRRDNLIAQSMER